MKKDDEADELALGELLAKKSASNAWIAEAATVPESKPQRNPDEEPLEDETAASYSVSCLRLSLLRVSRQQLTHVVNGTGCEGPLSYVATSSPIKATGTARTVPQRAGEGS